MAIRSKLVIASLTDSSTGTASDTIADAGAGHVQANENALRASLTAKVNAILVRLSALGN